MNCLCYFLWNLLFCSSLRNPQWTFCPWPHFFLKDGLSCIPLCNPLKLGHTLDIANMCRGMHAAQREVCVPLGSFTQTQSCAQLRLTRGCNTCGNIWWAVTRPLPLLFLKRQTHASHTLPSQYNPCQNVFDPCEFIPYIPPYWLQLLPDWSNRS